MEKPKGDEIKGQVESLQNLEEAAVASQSADPKEIEAKATQPDLRAQAVSTWWFVPYVVAALVVGIALLALDWQTFLRDSLTQKVRRYLFGAAGLIVVLAVAKAIDVYLIQRLRNPVSRFNLKRIVRLVTALVVAFIIISVLFVNWYAAVVSLGLISLIKNEIAKSIYLICRDLPYKKYRPVKKVYILHHVVQT